MAILLLTPRIYRNMKWSITPKDMFDTVSMSPITNANENEASEIATQDVISVSVNGEQKSLIDMTDNPQNYDDSLVSPLWRSVMYNAPLYVNLSRVDYLIGAGSVLFTFDKPVSTNLSAYITLEGKSSEIPRGTDFYNIVPAEADLRSDGFSLSSWVRQNATQQNNNSLLRNYQTYSVSSNPWTTRDEVYTYWASSPDFDPSYLWTEYQNYPLEGQPFTKEGTGSASARGSIRLTDDSIPLMANVRRIDDYRVRVNFSTPIRFAYLAFSSYKDVVGKRTFQDSWAFVDRVSKIKVHLLGYSLDASGNDISYSLNEAGTGLIEQAVNKRIYKVEKNELFTLNTYYGNNTAQKWSSKFALEFLQKYQKGKYLLNLDVPAKWAIENQIHCNSQLKIKLQDNTYIERKSSHCVFEVKTIEKSFKNNEFTFLLGLLEV